MTTLQVTRPADGGPAGEVQAASAADVATAVHRARAAQPAWGALPFTSRAAILRRLARRIRDDDDLAATLVAESGKPVHEAVGIEILYTCELTRFLTGRRARQAIAESTCHPLVMAHKRARVIHHPRGVVAVIGPWNWPLLNNYADAIAPLVAGNAVLLKPSEHTPLTSLRVAELARQAGVPADILTVLPGTAETGAALTEHADMIFFTGSLTTGRAVAQRAALRLIPCVLELGGKSPMIVLACADLERAAAAAVWSAFAHSGQVCIRTEVVLVEAAVAERFTALCRAAVARLRPGIDVGAMTLTAQIEHCQRQVREAIAAGARLEAGGGVPAGRRGNWLAPALLSGVTPDMAVAREETFGPVLPILAVADAEEALAIANASPFGLSGSVWTADRAKGLAIARRLESGSVCVNDVLVNYLCVEAPLGGRKQSGMGLRHGAESLRQFTATQTIVEDHPLWGLASPFVSRLLMFPYQPRVLAAIRWLMRRIYG